MTFPKSCMAQTYGDRPHAAMEKDVAVSWLRISNQDPREEYEHTADDDLE